LFENFIFGKLESGQPEGWSKCSHATSVTLDPTSLWAGSNINALWIYGLSGLVSEAYPSYPFGA